MADDKNIVVPPRDERVNYYVTGRIQAQYGDWALRDVVSSWWTRREWIRFFSLALVLWVPTVVATSSLSWSSLAIWGGVAIAFAATTPLRRKSALKRITTRPLPPQTSTSTGFPGAPVQQAGEEIQPDPMQAFYGKRR